MIILGVEINVQFTLYLPTRCVSSLIITGVYSIPEIEYIYIYIFPKVQIKCYFEYKTEV